MVRLSQIIPFNHLTISVLYRASETTAATRFAGWCVVLASFPGFVPRVRGLTRGFMPPPFQGWGTARCLAAAFAIELVERLLQLIELLPSLAVFACRRKPLVIGDQL